MGRRGKPLGRLGKPLTEVRKGFREGKEAFWGGEGSFLGRLGSLIRIYYNYIYNNGELYPYTRFLVGIGKLCKEQASYKGRI